jgi:hypothetical protein
MDVLSVPLGVRIKVAELLAVILTVRNQTERWRNQLVRLQLSL